MIHRGSETDLLLKPDVCVVGSGPGGAMVASRLSRAGAKVVVLEEGGYHQKDEFDMQESTAFPRLYQDRGNRASAESLDSPSCRGARWVAARVVNWTTSYRTPDDVLAHWRDREGLSLTPSSLRPHFEEVEAAPRQSRRSTTRTPTPTTAPSTTAARSWAGSRHHQPQRARMPAHRLTAGWAVRWTRSRAPL